jgi:4-hydroxyphenylpyruvate dioxygenase
MKFNHLHFYVDSVASWHERFVQTWGGTSIFLEADAANPRALVCLGQVPLLLTGAEQGGGPVAHYLQQHPPGIGDLAFCVHQLDPFVDRLLKVGGKLTKPIQQDPQQRVRWCQIQGWGPLRHTLVEPRVPQVWIPALIDRDIVVPEFDDALIEGIDHAVLNVATGQLGAATEWYARSLGFKPRQQFDINTSYSGLRSQVLVHPEGTAILPVNESATTNSQVEEFLYWNRGAGIQHVALHSRNIFQTVEQLRNTGVAFLDVPNSYYESLFQQADYQGTQDDRAELARLKILVDWNPQHSQAQLLQTFTQPLFDLPTLFFEIIQRRKIELNGKPIMAEGFGERNFLALFEAIEREQSKRGSLL